MSKYKVISIIISVGFLISSNALGDSFREPGKPDVNRTFSQKKETKVGEVAGLPAEQAFEQLKDDAFLAEPELLRKAIYSAFHNRKQDAFALVEDRLTLPITEFTEDVTVTRIRDFDVARRICETFPEDATAILVALYNGGDAVTRGNAVRAAGKVAGGKDIKHLLIRALDDRSTCESEDPQTGGDPLRVCDVAYNQLVLRYGVKHVFRTICPANPIEVRDQLVSILKGMFK